ncbi:helix-turn-helix domain-containing protein [Mycobacterium sp. M23085]|uniref:helix-turn-helix domain-containing protein n=1 Tax=Mycobacterium sp. M23085 TaxID=3378087 RepID=UPI0038780612
MDKPGKQQLRLKTTTKKVGGGNVRVQLGSVPEPEPPPVNLDTMDSPPGQPAAELDTMDPAQLRAQAAELLSRAAQLEAASRTIGADGRTRPTWDRFNNDQTEQQVRELRQAGQSVRDIAAVLGCSRGTAHRIIRKLEL